MSTSKHIPYDLQHRAVGSIVGQAVGDALGAPFEFRRPGLFAETIRDLDGANEMIGGGGFGWAPAEFTDDTQMAYILGRAIIEAHTSNQLFTSWKNWAKTARDVGTSTSRALAHPDLDSFVAERDRGPKTRGNGTVMRVSPVAVAGAHRGLLWTEAFARKQAMITHTDERTIEASVIMAVACASIIAGDHDNIDDAIRHAINNHCMTAHRFYFEALLLPNPRGHGIDDVWGLSNGWGDICLRDAVASVRRSRSYVEAVYHAVNLGNDADTVAAVAGALAGALYGVQSIPSRWTTYLHGWVDGRRINFEDLQQLATELAGGEWSKRSPDYGGAIKPVEVHECGVFATNLSGVQLADDDFAVISMCRTFGGTERFEHRRQFYLIDTPGANMDIDAVVTEALNEIDKFLSEGKRVLVHCHAGRSRTGLVLKAWYMRKFSSTADEADAWLTGVWPHYRKSNSDFTRYFEAIPAI